MIPLPELRHPRESIAADDLVEEQIGACRLLGERLAVGRVSGDDDRPIGCHDAIAESGLDLAVIDGEGLDGDRFVLEHNAVSDLRGDGPVSVTVGDQLGWRPAGAYVGLDGRHCVHVLGVLGEPGRAEDVQPFLARPPARRRQCVHVVDMVAVEMREKQIANALRNERRQVVPLRRLDRALDHAVAGVEDVGLAVDDDGDRRPGAIGIRHGRARPEHDDPGLRPRQGGHENGDGHDEKSR